MNDIKEIQNTYAEDLEGNPIHISSAISGRKGYYCLGCKREMQAVKTIIDNRKSYFRHDAEATKGQKKCTYSDETHRHKIAKDIISRLKYINLPPVIKYSPIKEEKTGVILINKETKFADYVAVERYIYENSNGSIQIYQTEQNDNTKNLLIKPDIIFFDSNKIPFLLIEIIATHNLSEEKKIKLKRIGIDTIQIKISKGTPEEIEKSIYETTNIKWIYNVIEERTEYIRTAKGTTEGILPFDEDQRKLFEENFNCRAAQINKLVRSINRNLESEQFKRTQFAVGSEIQRIEAITKIFRKQFEDSERSIIQNLHNEFRGRREEISKSKQELFIKTEELERKYRELEERYLSKRREIETTFIEEESSTNEIERETERIRDFDERYKKEFERSRTEIEDKIIRIPNDFESKIRNEDEEVEGIEREINGLPVRYAKIKEELIAEFRIKEDEEQRIEDEYRKFESQHEFITSEEERALDKEFEAIRNDIIKSIETKTYSRRDDYSRELQKLLEYGKLLQHFKQISINLKRNRKAKEFFIEGTYKNWINL